MTTTEFKKWYSAHRSAFPGIDRQISEMVGSRQHGESEPLTSQDVLRSWKETLHAVEFDDAIAATALLASGDKEYPRYLDDHPRLVLEVARKLKSRRAPAKPPGPQLKQIGPHEYEDTFECSICRDDGNVVVFSLDAMHAMRDGTYQRTRPPIPRYQTNVVRCSCKWGDYYSGTYPVMFDANKMVELRNGNTPRDEDVERLKAFVSQPVEPTWQEWQP